MANRDSETHLAGLADLPLVRRLGEHAAVLDNELAYTSDYGPSSTTLLSGIILPSRSEITVVGRAADQQVIGHVKVRVDDPLARLSYLAPTRAPGQEDSAWLGLLDGLVREAGKLHAQALLAEVEQDSPLFETLRTAGFSLYARQQVWHRQGIVEGDPACRLYEERQSDITGVHALMTAIMPPMLLHFAQPASDMPRLVYLESERVMGYVAYSIGKRGVYVLPFLHPQMHEQPDTVLCAAFRMVAPAPKLPVTVVVRRGQEFVAGALERLGFSAGVEQALMVKHIAAGVRTSAYATLSERLANVNAKPRTQSHLVL